MTRNEIFVTYVWQFWKYFENYSSDLKSDDIVPKVLNTIYNLYSMQNFPKLWHSLWEVTWMRTFAVTIESYVYKWVLSFMSIFGENGHI